MTNKMINNRLEIVKMIAQGMNNTQIARNAGHSRSFIIKVRNDLKNDVLFKQEFHIGRPSIITEEVKQQVRDITMRNRRMSSKTIARIICQNQKISYGTVYNIRKELGFNFLPPRDTFLLSNEQKQHRVDFATRHLQQQTDWTKVLFVDESMFYLDNNHRWIWRRRGEIVEDIFHKRSKFTPKIMVFGGISYHYKPPLIAIRGNIDSDIYITECIKRSNFIEGMNSICGKMGWTLLQDGATCHTSKKTMEFLNGKCNVMSNRPANSPDLNVIENLWAILKEKVETLNPQSIDQMIDLIFSVWNEIAESTIRNLIDSMPNRLQEVVKKWKSKRILRIFE